MCPYWINNLELNIKGPFSGKGTPGQIIHSTKRRANNLNVSLEKMDAASLVNFMNQNKIGIDCSGFVFHLENSLDQETGGKGIASKLLENNNLPSWRAAWRINANKLLFSIDVLHSL